MKGLIKNIKLSWLSLRTLENCTAPQMIPGPEMIPDWK